MTTPTPRRITPTGVLVLTAQQMADRPLWLAERRKGIGSSDVPAILGLEDAFATAAHVYHDKRGDDVDGDSEPALWGRLLEDTVALEWCRRNRSVIDRIGLVAHEDADRRWQLASIDRRVRECPLDRSVRSRCGLEIKCRSAFKSHLWHRDAPDDVLAQVVWQIAVTGFDHMHWAVLVGGNDFRQGVVFRDSQLGGYIVDQVTAFRERHILDDVEPAWDWTKAARLIELDERLHPDRTGEIDVIEIGAVIEYGELSRAARDAEKAREAGAARLREIARGHQVVTFANEPAFRLGARRRSNVDLGMLAERWPDAYAACVSETAYHQIELAKQYKAGVAK